ncbi:EAL domain-containing protein [Pseudoxanthomonas sp. SL93]|uniref:EAL domain-containing protein n=1 Tax=Pseudoxanthomonas sp. SL93 TaxID=2995142 RepID=UPI0022722374|nr:EAL domain-containing protein [Pseudoxanthomonas sp. SL93]WAC62036.1 EAL domain-containing protein [Pseudoxanthomonas sp. SL93]
MWSFWSSLRRCWALPDADEEARAVLLDRQLRHLFRMVPWHVASTLLTGAGVAYVMAPFLAGHAWQAWALCLLATHLGWVAQATRRLRQMERGDKGAFTISDLRQSAFWCVLCACTGGVGLYLAAPLAASDGSRLLLAAYTPALIATGVLVGVTAPLVAFLWLVILTVAACLVVGRLDFMAQGMTIAQLCCYATMLTITLLFVSRTLVRRIEAEMAAERQQQIIGLLLRDFEQNANDWLWESDCQGHLTRASVRLSQVLEKSEDTIVGAEIAGLFSQRRLLSLRSDQDVGPDALRARLASGVSFSRVVVEVKHADTVRSWAVSAKPLKSEAGEWTGWRGVGCDVTDARAREAEDILREQRLHHLANHDALTGLPNRRAFLSVLPGDGRGTGYQAIALVDLDNFKMVNDSLGHSVGDDILRVVAARLQAMCQPGDYLARLGGDEFALLLSEGRAPDRGAAVLARLERVLEALRVPEEVNSFRVDVRASIGCALVEAPDQRLEELLRRADTALNVAKKEGRDTARLHVPAMSERLEERLAMVSDLSLAAGAGQLELHYLALRTSDELRVHGYEALLRWRHPLYGFLSPATFIPVAEECGLIVPIGLWVLEQACRDALAWRWDISVSVNVSPLQLTTSNFVESVVAVLHRVGFPPQRLELEITESAIARDPVSARAMLGRLRHYGIQIAIDDFGVGYSSMAQLRELPFDRIKLDQSFAAGLRKEDAAGMSRSIIASVISLARSLDMTVTAEGVEDREQLEILRALGCPSVQGFILGGPVPARLLETA